MARYGAKGKYPTEEDYLFVPRLTYTPVHQRKAERLAWEEKQAKNKPEKEKAAKEKTSNDGMEAKAKKEKDFKEAKERWEQNAKKQIAEEKAVSFSSLALKLKKREGLTRCFLGEEREGAGLQSSKEGGSTQGRGEGEKGQRS